MKSNSLSLLTCGLLAASLLVGFPRYASAQTADEILEAARSVIRADRHAVVTDTMQFTEAEAKEFWPIYHRYRTEMATAGDGIKHLVLEYAGLYPNVPEARAKRMLKDLLALEKEQTALRAKYLKKVAKVLPPAKALRFAQVESRLDLAVRLELAAGIPLVPIDGQIAGRLSEGAVFVEGTAGGVYVRTVEINAEVVSIDSTHRRLTLLDTDGIKETVKVGPEAVNFEEIEVGDRLRLTVTEELVVQTATPGEIAEDSGVTLVALAPEGAKPGGMVAEAVQVTGTVSAIDEENRTATLRFEDGRSETFPVRGDVNLRRHRVGDRVTFLVTETVAIRVEEP